MRTAGGFTFFYGSSEPFSNWFRSPFVEGDGGVSRRFPTSEHYMMYMKAQHFGDTEVAQKILKTTDPRVAKRLGRQVRSFDAQEWQRVARTIVYQGCRLKFTQNAAAYDALVATQGTRLVEAAPSDLIWGVGLSQDDDRILDPGNWRGSNWLGQVLTVLRDDLIASTCSLERLSWESR
jgi:ribA/ribD-fused uncharacterized protein